MKGLTDRVALITGASRGIGAATAVLMAEAGADVAINYHANRAAADLVADKVRSFGRRAEVYQADITSWDDCQRMSEAALSDFGSVDILVNNAGIGYETYGTPLLTEHRPGRHAALHRLQHAGLPVHDQAPRAPDARPLGAATSSWCLRSRPRPCERAWAPTASRRPAWRRSPSRWRRRSASTASASTSSRPASSIQRWATVSSIATASCSDKETFAAKTRPSATSAQPEDVAGAILYLCSDESPLRHGPAHHGQWRRVLGAGARAASRELRRSPAFERCSRMNTAG